MTTPLIQLLRQRIQKSGPLSFRDFMEEALYHPQFGYYSSSRNPVGKDGDFFTSSNLDPVFGKLIARRFQAMAEELGVPPESFTILELGAGSGLLARDILQFQPFPYRILERSAAMRERQRHTLAGFEVKWIDELPRDFTGCMFSNEFFDALPVHQFVATEHGWRERCVALSSPPMYQWMSSARTPYSCWSMPRTKTAAVDPYWVVPTRLPFRSRGPRMPASGRT